jgi:glycolate oxidase iron-sulfur subunit
MKAYGTLLADDPAWRERAARFAARVRDVSEILAEQPLRGPLRPVARTVTYHDPCHVVHGQKIRTQPRALLAQIPGLRVVELNEADWCCGSAGTYNLTQPEMATRLQERKVAHVQATGADAVVTANPGCIIQIAQGLAAKGSPIQVLHLVELLDQAYSPSPPKGERAG